MILKRNVIAVVLKLAIVPTMFSGCAFQPQPTDFERCMTSVAGDSVYMRLQSAEFCEKHIAHTTQTSVHSNARAEK